MRVKCTPILTITIQQDLTIDNLEMRQAWTELVITFSYQCSIESNNVYIQQQFCIKLKFSENITCDCTTRKKAQVWSEWWYISPSPQTLTLISTKKLLYESHCDSSLRLFRLRTKFKQQCPFKAMRVTPLFSPHLFCWTKVPQIWLPEAWYQQPEETPSCKVCKDYWNPVKRLFKCRTLWYNSQDFAT